MYLAIVNNAYGACLAGPTWVTLTTAWQRFRITGTLASGQTALWIVTRQYDSNGDDWTTVRSTCGERACSKATTEDWVRPDLASETTNVAAGVACGAVVIPQTTIRSRRCACKATARTSRMTGSLEAPQEGELTIAGGTGNGYRMAELAGASNHGWIGA